MELRQTAAYPNHADTYSRTFDDAWTVEDRLNLLLEINREAAAENAKYRDDLERREAEMMSRPVTMENAFAYFGLMLGALPPAAIFLRFLMAKGLPHADEMWIVGLLLITNLTAAAVGYFTGKRVAKTLGYLYSLPLSRSLIVIPFVGMVWGMIAGAAGGVFLFVIGAFFGAAIGGTVGAVALPAFVILHKLLKRGHVIDMRHFLPISLGLTLVICAFFLGL
jgi:hypothetical protein